MLQAIVQSIIKSKDQPFLHLCNSALPFDKMEATCLHTFHPARGLHLSYPDLTGLENLSALIQS